MDWSRSTSKLSNKNKFDASDTIQVDILRTDEIQMMDTVEIKKMLDRDELHDRLDRLYFKIWVLTSLFLFYSCLIPMHISSEADIIQNIQKIRWTPYIHDGKFESLTDIGSNIVLFMPFGFLTLSLWYRKLRWIGIVVTTFSGMLASIVLEMLQLLVTIRTTSITDVCNNTLGTFIGALIYALFRKQFAKFIFLMFIKEIHSNVLQIYSHGILVCIFLLGLEPYHFNFDLGMVKSNIKFIFRHVEFIPRWDYMRECLNNLFLFTLAGFFMTIAYFKKKNWLTYILYTFFINVFLVCVIELLRIFLAVTSIAIPKIFFACVGIVNGILWGLFYVKSPNLARDSRYFFYLIFIAFLLFNYFYPFQWADKIQIPDTSAIIPFSIYFFSIDPQRSAVGFGSGIADMILQIILFLPIGFAFSTVKKRYISIFFIGFFFCFLLEFSQIFIHSRCFDMTDAIVGGFGCVVGHSLKWRFQNLLTRRSIEDVIGLDSTTISLHPDVIEVKYIREIEDEDTRGIPDKGNILNEDTRRLKDEETRKLHDQDEETRKI